MQLNKKKSRFHKITAIGMVAIFFFTQAEAQQTTVNGSGIVPTNDVKDVFRKVFKKKTDTSKISKPPRFAILPSFGYNPSFGVVIGAKLSAGKQYGNTENTDYSIFGMEALYTSKGIITVQARHNVFTAGNKFNFQGNWQLSKFGIIDYGIGTGNNNYHRNEFVVNDYPTTNGDSSFPIKYTYIRFFEKVYRKIGPHLFAGGGIGLGIYSSIKDKMQSDSFNTPHQYYSLQNGFNPKKYSANSFLFAIQYNTREHPLRSYGGIYADINLRFNQRWLGSTKNAVQLQYDFRKYWSLSKRNPAHVLAIWNWASFKLAGELPYLAMPSTGSDTYARSGRGYTIGYFKGPSFAYFETEYRFPITRDKFLSGVCFINSQTAADAGNSNLFSSWAMGYGAGLRILLQKESRSTVCIDFSKGNYGSSGIFFGLNEVF